MDFDRKLRSNQKYYVTLAVMNSWVRTSYYCVDYCNCHPGCKLAGHGEVSMPWLKSWGREEKQWLAEPLSATPSLSLFHGLIPFTCNIWWSIERKRLIYVNLWRHELVDLYRLNLITLTQSRVKTQSIKLLFHDVSW